MDVILAFPFYLQVIVTQTFGTASWGWDLKQNLTFLEINPWITVFPGLSIFLTMLGFNLLGDGLCDALDPRLKQ